MIIALCVLGYLLVGFIVGIIWHLLDWSDATEEFMIMTFMIAWPIIVVIYLICAISIPIEKATNRLAKKVINTIKGWTNK